MRTVFAENPLSLLVQSDIDELDVHSDAVVDVHESNRESSLQRDPSVNNSANGDHGLCDFSRKQAMQTVMEDLIEFYWLFEYFCYAGEVTGFNGYERCLVVSDENKQEAFNMCSYNWRYV